MTNEDKALEIYGRELAATYPEPPQKAMAESRARVMAQYRAGGGRYWDAIDTPIGRLYLLATDAGLERVSFADSQAEFLRQVKGSGAIERNPDRIRPYAAALGSYFTRGKPLSGIRYNLSNVTEFQRLVLSTIRRIPAGKVWSYKQLAQAIGKPRAARAVGQALGSNPLPIVLPCHRVIASDGGLGGYGGGRNRKRRLLQLEGAAVR
jgi:methylated-DNA-[protein]-cysteine S-methyltransferase